jgi:hypothetical protein
MIQPMHPAGRATRRVQRLLARTGRGPLTPAWRALYVAVARLAGRHLAGGTRHASVYVRGSTLSTDLVPGVSDVDLVILLDGGTADAAAVHRRRERLARHVPVLAQLVDRPRTYRVEELDRLLGRTAYTWRIGDEAGGASPEADLSAGIDRDRMLERPGLYDTTGDWRLLAGRERRPAERPRTPGEQAIAAWLELVYYWKRAFGLVADPSPAHAAALCVKLVSEPARIALWLEHGERVSSRIAALEEARRLLPDHASAVSHLADVQSRLHSMPMPPIRPALVLLARLSELIAASLGRRAADGTSVRLVGSQPPPRVPLCDWRAVVRPDDPGGSFRVEPGDPGDAAAVRLALERDADDERTALAGDGILVLPSGERARAAMRAVASRVTDPVSFALLDGAEHAVFPDAEGWSAEDWAERAVEAHRLRLAGGSSPGLTTLVGAARAAVLHESIATGDATLAVTPTAALELLAELAPHGRDSALLVAAALEEGREPDDAARAGLEATLRRLPALTPRPRADRPAAVAR